MFETLYADPARLASFLSAMTGMSHGANMAIAAKFPWEKYKTYVDAGTAQGDLAVQVALSTRTCAASDSTCPSSNQSSKRTRRRLASRRG